MKTIAWSEGSWRNPPSETDSTEGVLSARSGDHTDMWRHTSYGFVHDSGHALLAPLEDGEAMECDVEANYQHQFDQAGLMVFASATQWIKCGIEYSDGLAQLGAVVTREVSDWSAAPVPDWATGVTSFRVSRSADALTIRAKRVGEDWQLVRLAPIDASQKWQAGPYLASPTREGFEVRFSRWQRGPADSTLHE